MKIANINYLGFKSNINDKLITHEVQNNSFVKKQNFASIPLETWQAYKVNKIAPVSFMGKNENKKTIPVVIMMGPPLAGKGTTAAIIKEEHNIPHISIGEMLRSEAKKGTELGKIVKPYIDNGVLIPSDMVIEILSNRIEQDDCKNGFILDGFPRRNVEAEAFLELLEKKKEEGLEYNPTAIKLIVDKPVLLERLNHRALVEKRKDDTPETFEKRLQTYDKETVPVEDMFKEKGYLNVLDTKAKIGNQPSEYEIYKQVESFIKEFDEEE